MSNSTMISGVNNDEWTQAAGKAKEAAASVGAMASHAGSAVGAMMNQATRDVGRKADELAASAGVGMQGLGDRLSQNAPQAGVLGSASQAVARTVKAGGEYLEVAKLRGITEDAAQLIRRNPIPAVFVALGLGWLVSRSLSG